MTFTIEKLKAEVESLVNVNKESSFKSINQERSLFDLRGDLKSTRDELEIVQNDKRQLLNQMQQTNNNHNNVVLNKNSELQQKSQQIQEMSEKINFLGNELSNLNENISRLLQSNNSEENRKLKNILCEKENALAKLTNDFEQTKLQLAKACENSKNKIQDLESEKVLLNNKLIQKGQSDIKLKTLLNHQVMKTTNLEKELKKKEKEFNGKMNGYLIEHKQKEKILFTKWRFFLEEFQNSIQLLKYPGEFSTSDFPFDQDIFLEEIFEKILERIRFICSAHGKYVHDQKLEHQEMCEQLKTLKNEIEKANQEIQQEKLAKQKMERLNEEMTADVSSLKISLQGTGEKLRQETNGFQERIKQLSHQTRLLKKQIETRDMIISDSMILFNKEISLATHKFQEVSKEYDSQNNQITILRKNDKEYMLQISELKELLNESHIREEQARCLFQKKNFKSDCRQLEDINSPSMSIKKY